MDLARRVLEGDRLSLARLLTQIENDNPQGYDALASLYPHTGRAHIIGITGAPGTGKSTLVNHLARLWRTKTGASRDGEQDSSPRIAIVAVDPSSPFTGGAILGDRIRMRDLAGDSGVFIRSMASRGALGGVARATSAVVEILDAAGYDAILIETVGAGQAEVDIARTAHTVIVIGAPGLGDEVQAIKAGILEIADILVVNKADLPGADNTIRALRSIMEISSYSDQSRTISAQSTAAKEQETDETAWKIPVLATVALRGEGLEPLLDMIQQHLTHLKKSGGFEIRERQRIHAEMITILRDRLESHFFQRASADQFARAVACVQARELSPRQAIDQLMQGEKG